MATLISASFIRRSRITRLWTFLPSLPASGLSLMPKVTLMVGGSIGCEGRASITSGWHSVSATVALAMPAIVTMSPASATSIGVCVRPRNAMILLMRNCSSRSPSRDSAFSVSPALAVPASTRPVSRRPRKASAPSVVASIWNGSSARVICLGGWTCFRIRSNSASMFLRSPSSVASAQPPMPEA